MIFDAHAFADLIASKVADKLARTIGDDILTTKQAAELLQVHETTVSQMAAAGDLPGRKLGRDWRFRRSALLDHITTQHAHTSLRIAGDWKGNPAQKPLHRRAGGKEPRDEATLD